MPDGIGWVGLDVHARESTFAVFDQASGEVSTKRVVGRPHELLPYLRGIERPSRMVYEAGPTGYGLARRALAEGIELGVCAPGKTERPAADRIKTDKRDAVRLARLLAAGELVLVTIPSVEREQLRDLEAAYRYRRGSVVGGALERRQRGHAPEIINISWKAQRRLNARWRQLKDARRKPGGVVAVAIARELAAYCWEIATCPTTAPEPTPTPTTRKRLTNSR